jgi:SAM-dependent methyltransferase
LAKKALACVFFWKAKLYRSDFLHLEGMRPGRVLEVGCGDGAFLAAAARKGWESIGLDFDAAAVAQASRLPGVTADVGELNGKEYPGSSFDAIVMSNVIEHLANPGETLAECRRLLRPGGRLVIITPNFESLGRKLFKHNWRGLEPPRHLYLYAGNSLRSLCRQAGFLDMQIGSSPGGEAGREILLASIKIAHSSATGQSAPSRAVSKDAISLVIAKEYLLTLCGLSVGEWLVAILEK